MPIAHHRLSFIARWIRRCPDCGAWFSLQRIRKTKDISGVKNEYACPKCEATFQDWKPSERVKF